jgi:quinoprotein glucose dehydrogenase
VRRARSDRRCRATLLATLLLAACGGGTPVDTNGPVAGWREWGGDAGGSRFSPLTQLTPQNVGELEIAWTYHTGDVSTGTQTHGPTAFQATPLVIGERMYLCTPYNRVIALDAETGRELWVHDPKVDLTAVYTPVCRGLGYWEEVLQDGVPCRKRLFTGTLDARLLALDAETGQACAHFGEAGVVDLGQNLGDVRPGEYYVTAAPLIAGDLVVTGAFVQDGQRVDAPPGVVRAFDARTGALRWAFDPVPPTLRAVDADDAARGAQFTRGTPNVWGQMSFDAVRGLVYLPTGNPQPDHYGGKERQGKDHYGSSVVALDVRDGRPRWRFQTVHHDVWDYDVAAQPVLFTQPGSGREGVVAATKTGHLFLLDRVSGEPLFPVEERAVPQSTVPGEHTAATQPFPTLPVPLHPHAIDEHDVWGLTPIDRDACRERFAALHTEGIFTPPGLTDTLEYPGLGGGVNWGSVSVNPGRGVMLVASMRAAYTVRLAPRAQVEGPNAAADQVGMNPQEGTPYVVVRGAYLSAWNTPCVAPPWSKLTAIDLATGQTLWEKPLGTLRHLAPLGTGDLFAWGGPIAGGSIQTASGLAFIGATMDGYLRAFDVANGEELWRHALPAPGQATPVTYRTRPDGRQFVAIAAGGHGPLAYVAKGPEDFGELLGDAVVAFALPAQ